MILNLLDIIKNYKYPVIFDATHSVQEPGGLGEKSGGKENLFQLYLKLQQLLVLLEYL